MASPRSPHRGESWPGLYHQADTPCLHPATTTAVGPKLNICFRRSQPTATNDQWCLVVLTVWTPL